MHKSITQRTLISTNTRLQLINSLEMTLQLTKFLRALVRHAALA